MRNRISVFLISVLLPFIIPAQEREGSSYKVPAGSQLNRINLKVLNRSPHTVSEVGVIAEEIPSCIKFKDSYKEISEIPGDGVAEVEFSFDIDNSAKIDTTVDLVFIISTQNGEKWEKIIKIDIVAPDKFVLEQNFPNPFNPKTTILYQLPLESDVVLSIYNIIGQKVEILVNEKQGAGIYNIEWDASNVASGMYFYRILARDAKGVHTAIKKMLIIK